MRPTRLTLPLLSLLAACHTSSVGKPEGPSCAFYPDEDGDGYGLDAKERELSCAVTHEGYVQRRGDCDDGDPDVHPEAVERCNGLDDDCDGTTEDEGEPWYADLDGDGFGDAADALLACDAVEGRVEDDGDCDDGDPDVHPNADERCNGLDDDCDGTAADENLSWYADLDGDGWGDPDTRIESCEPPVGAVLEGGDCDDRDARVHPDQEDGCDGVDLDCDGLVDEDAPDDDKDGLPDCGVVLYEEDFDDETWPGWTVFNLGGRGESWGIGEGVLWEYSDAGNSVAVAPDLGFLDAFTVQAGLMVAGRNCNDMGLVFGWESVRDYLMIRWRDPAGDYGGYPSGGNLDLYRCDGGACVSLATDDGSPRLVAATGAWVLFELVVDGDRLTLSYDDEEVLGYVFLDGLPVGPGRVGFWSHDCDNGACFDDLRITSP